MVKALWHKKTGLDRLSNTSPCLVDPLESSSTGFVEQEQHVSVGVDGGGVELGMFGGWPLSLTF